MNLSMSLYGVSICHPEDWRIYINPNRPFTEREGTIKVENMKGDLTEQISLSISWEDAGQMKAGFAQRYLDQIDDQYKNGLKKEKRYHIQKKEMIELCGHEACFVHSTMRSNTHVFRALGKNVTLDILQAAVHCTESGRVVVATITGATGLIQSRIEEWTDLLLTLKCHCPWGAEREREREYAV